MKKCKTCGSCNRLYRRPLFAYYKDDKYLCDERNEVIDGQGGCSLWKKKEREKVDLSRARFDEAIEDLGYLLREIKDKK